MSKVNAKGKDLPETEDGQTPAGDITAAWAGTYYPDWLSVGLPLSLNKQKIIQL